VMFHEEAFLELLKAQQQAFIWKIRPGWNILRHRWL
jgi:hypothetical protein